MAMLNIRRMQHARALGISVLAAVGLSVLAAGVVPVAAADPCATQSSNPIPCENSKPGTPQTVWDVNGAGDASIQGFATDLSVNVGQTINFKIDTSSTNYNLTIYRLGYYQGNGARQIAVVTPSASLPQNQPACLSDPATALLDCGNWAVSASWAVPSTAVSGIYLALLTDAATGAQSHIPFIVRNDSSHSDILFRTDDTTWEAYNDYGGSSLYYGTNANAPAAGGYAAGRAFKVSYNRPFNTRGESVGYGTSNYIFYGEYPMIRWLEANGYDVSYFTSIDLVRLGSLMLNHKVILSAGHDEYWSNEMRTAYYNARDAGVNIANFTGNEDFWKTRWENSIDGSNTPDRTIVCYKETLQNQVIDPKDPPTWTGTWRDPRFSPPADGGKPENGLGGTIFAVNRGTAAPVISSAFAKLRFWRNTAVASLQTGQTLTLGDQAIGYEWDIDADNGARPAGLIDLSATTVSVPELIQDNGTVYQPGTAVHSLTLYRAKSGALVFSAGTVQWVWGLDTTHDTSPDTGPANPDVNMEQSTVNLLADMHAQPATLQAGLVATVASTDNTAPTSTITSPTSGASLTGGSQITITGTATDAGGGVVAGVEVSTDGGTTWHRATGTTSWQYPWVAGAPGSVKLLSRATDDSANTETPSAGVSVTVNPRTCPCSLIPTSATPADPATNDPNSVELGLRFTADQAGSISAIKFFKGTGNNGTHTASLWTDTGTLLGQGTFTNETGSGWQTFTFASPIAINGGTTYVASYHAPSGTYAVTSGYFSAPVNAPPLHSASGSNGVYTYSAGPAFPSSTYGSTNYWVDVVYSPGAPTSSPPTVTSESPASGATSVSFGQPVSATFSVDVNPTSVTFSVTDANNVAASGSVAYSSATLTATFSPTAALAQGMAYTASITASSKSGTAMTAPFTWKFTTARCPCNVFATSATPGVPFAADSPVELGMKFHPDSSGYVNAIRFYKGSGNTGVHVGDLWSSTGTLLGSVTFSGETASGWQEAALSSPVAVTAGTTYVVSYHSNSGYGYTAAGFATPVDSGPLHAPAAGNGLYSYGSGSVFPTQSYNSTNYFVDVSFNTTAGDTTPPAVASTSPANGATGVNVEAPITFQFSKSVVASSIQFSLTANSAAVAGSLSYNSTNFTATFKQSTATLAGSTTYSATVSAATDQSGNKLASPVTWSFTTGSCCTLFSASSVPAVANVNDANAVELGMRFTADVSGTVLGVRFYKGSGNTGTHTGSLWSSTGQLLAQATFVSETASGWQEVKFAQPVAITAGTVYTVSYHTSVGSYSATSFYFNSSVDNVPLHAPAGSNGVYLYGTGGFPTNSYNSTNYWVDVDFKPS